MGDALTLRMSLVSNKGAKAASNLVPLRTSFLTSLRARLPWFKIGKVTFYILKTIMSIRLEKFMLGDLILFLIMLICTVMRLLALGIPLISKCLREGLLMHLMDIASHSKILMYLLCLLTNQAWKLPNMLGVNTRAQRLVFGYPRCLFLM
jgi:hypothetical protein